MMMTDAAVSIKFIAAGPLGAGTKAGCWRVLKTHPFVRLVRCAALLTGLETPYLLYEALDT